MKIAGRYEITAKVGQGGMGVVYRAYDPAPMDREVAVKTLHEFADPLALDLFYRECRALKSISHPNIVEIFDMGEFEEGGQKRPFFVMPLLPGQTLDELIRKASHRLTVDRVVEIISQTCRGLQAAHDRGLVHRDLKPSNIFVMADDSVKLIDFGVAHAVTARSRTTGFDKGTLLYMAPEQLQHKPVSAQSDIYALGLTMYEALTRRQPFRLGNESEVIEAILNQTPPPASSLNPAVSQLMSRAVHKAIAKQPWNRYETAREFSDTLQKALRNESIPMFDPARVQPRIQTALKALEKGDDQFAGEIVSELEAEGNPDSQIAVLRAQINHVARQKTLTQLLDSARSRYEEGEDPLALQKINEVLHLDPDNTAALGLKASIDERRGDRQFEKWIMLARQHADNQAYANAHDALQNARALRPDDSRVLQVMREIEAAGSAGAAEPVNVNQTNIPTSAERTLLKPPSGTRIPQTPTPSPSSVPSAASAATASVPAPAPVSAIPVPPVPVETKREPSSPLRLVGIVGAIAALATVVVIAFVWTSLTPVEPGVPQNSAPAPVTPAPASTPTVPPAIETQPAPVSAPPPIAETPVPLPTPPPLPAPSASAPARTPAAAPPPRRPASPPVATQPAPGPAAPAPQTQSAPAPVTPPSSTTPPQSTTVVDAPLPPVLAAARAVQLLELGSQSEKAEDWPAALRYYERARTMDPSLGGVASTNITRVQAQMSADGADSFKRAQGFDASNRVNDAITWYERAVRNLPDSSAEKRTAIERLRVLKAGR